MTNQLAPISGKLQKPQDNRLIDSIMTEPNIRPSSLFAYEKIILPHLIGKNRKAYKDAAKAYNEANRIGVFHHLNVA